MTVLVDAVFSITGTVHHIHVTDPGEIDMFEQANLL